MDLLHLDGPLAFPSIISLAEINAMIYLLLPVYSYQQPSSSIDEYFNFNQLVSKKGGWYFQRTTYWKAIQSNQPEKENMMISFILSFLKLLKV